MKKFIALLCVLALSITCLVSIEPEKVNAATKDTPTVKTSNCKLNAKTITKYTNLYSAVKRFTRDDANYKISNLTKKHAYIQITAPANGTLFLQGVSGCDIYACTDGDLSNYDRFPVRAFNNTSRKVEDLILTPTVVSDKYANIMEYPMYSGEVVYLHVTKECEFKAAWVSSKDILSIQSYNSVGKIEFKIQTGIEYNKNYELKYFDYTSGLKGDKNTYKAYTKSIKKSYDKSNENGAESTDFAITKTSSTNEDFTATNNDKLSYLRGSFIGESIVNLYGQLVNIGIDFNIDDTNIVAMVWQYYPNLLKYNKQWIADNSPEIIYSKAGTNVVFGYGKPNSDVSIVYNKKTYTAKTDVNGYFYVTLKNKLSKNKTLQAYYTNNGVDLSNQITIQ